MHHSIPWSWVDKNATQLDDCHKTMVRITAIYVIEWFYYNLFQHRLVRKLAAFPIRVDQRQILII